MASLELFLTAILFSTALGKLSCRDPANNPVDWFVVTKLPQNSKQITGPTLTNDGLLHAYITSESLILTWSVPSSIRGLSTVLSNTLGQPTDATVNYLAYNDDEAETDEFELLTNSSILANNAHAKGFTWINADGSGIWFVHSLPKYQPLPGNPASWIFPENARNYGQIMFCISFEGANNKATILRHIRFMNSIILAGKNNFPEIEYGALPVGLPGSYLEAGITSAAGQTFQLLSKAHPRGSLQYREDIFEYYRRSGAMRVLTWGPNISNFPGVEANTWCGGTSTGNPMTTNDIQEILMRTIGDYSFLWGACTSNSGISRQDHSKWAIMDGTSFCMADMNRIETQTRRSGGLVCFENSILRGAFSTMIYR